MKTQSHNQVKGQEARRRMTAMRQARRGLRSASILQKRASLVGKGANWRITNFSQVARTMAKWA